MLKKLLLMLLLAGLGLTASAQRATIKGIVADTSGKVKLQNSSVLLIRDADSVLVTSLRTNAEGAFELKNIPKGRYQVIITYPKMADYIGIFNLSDSSKINIGTVNMELQSKVIQEVVIRAQRDAIKVRGDTISYQADSFKVAEGANVQELLKRLPGFEIGEDGAIKAQGKDVVNVLVDGDEFFGDDPLMATKYLKAKSVKEVEVYDKKSKNTELTGIEDGKTEKTVNIKLKDDAKNGYLSNLDANTNGKGLNDYGGMFGVFKDKLKAAVYGTKSNIGLQSKVNRAMSSLKGGDFDMIEVGDDGSVMIMGMGDSDDYFNPQSGLPNNLTLGAHLSNKWNKSRNNYKFNYKYTDRGTENITTSNSQRLLPNGSLFISSGNSNNNSNAKGNDLKANFEMAVDSLAVLKFAFGVKNSTGDNNSTSFSETHYSNGINISENNQMNYGNSTSDLYNGNINYTRKSKKLGRTLAIDLQPEFKSSTGIQNSLNKTLYYDPSGNLDRTENLNLLKDNRASQNSIASRISYSEPISKYFTLQASYSFKNTHSESYKVTYDKNILFGSNPKLVDSLSNNFKFNSMSHVGRGVLQFRKDKISINAGLEATETNFSLNDLDRNNKFKRNYLNLGPSSNLNYKVGRNSNLSLRYNGSTKQPSLDQLQPIREINDPLYQVVGNPNLKPSFNNDISLNYNTYNQKTQQSLYGYVSYGFINNEIVTTEKIDQNNKRVVSYININGNKNYSGYLSYYKSFAKIKASIGVDANYNGSQRTAYLNNVLNKSVSNNYAVGLSFSHYSDVLSFSYRPRASFSTGTSTIGEIYSGNVITYNHDISSTLQLPYNTEFTTGINIVNRPANAAFPEPLNIAQWNSSFAVKALKDKSLQVRISVNDILNQKIGYNRSVSGNMVSENTYSYIPRYVLLGINYNLSGNFTKNSASK